DVVVGRAAVAPAVPVARPADVGDAVPGRRVDALAALGRGEAALPAALDGDAEEVGVAGVLRAAGRHEQDVLAAGRPAGRDVVGGVEGEAARPAALGGDNEDVVGAVPLGGEGEGSAVGAEARVEVVGEVLGDRAGDAAD